ncbi:unnamed protein product [Caenorhabditis angaria]|uniref:Chorein N-terminal domain-containing protein n=1 Tax=Caenorhabditis angaria TaxID=860376 RepID=A0A9P1NB10_9PELO|nr:unnamed protein product [Caenorhabditis angaria]
MAGLIKNQLVKHLSKFTRNLKPEQISLDVLRGNSKLQFIEINEEVLTDILELPTWLRIKRAYCTGVTVNVPWTRLKSSPIQIFIDEINVDVELSSGPPAKRGENPFGNLGDSNSYGFIEKNLEINFDSDAFGGSFMLQRLSVESRSPGWAPVQDLKHARINCSVTNRTLMYKQLSWHLLRIEASAKSSKDEKRSKINAPLRLITSGGKIRIALKKSSVDGKVIHARIQTILEDILWVATLPQLRSAISFASYIMSLVQESQKEMIIVPTPSGFSNRSQVNNTPGVDASNSTFKAFHFDQTSYHLHVKKIDLHLCDDANASSCYPPNWNIESGAMQVTLFQVLIDAYPKALASSDRSTWMRYSTPNAFTNWMHSRLSEQYNEIMKETKDSTLRTRLERCWPQMMGFHVIVRMFDLTIQCVSDMNTKKDALKNLFVSERHLRSLPSDQHIVHFEFANYFHPMTDTLPVPKPAAYLQLGPFSLTFDERTLRWCLYVAHNLQSAIEDGKLKVPVDANVQAPDLRFDLLMPKIIIPLPNPVSDARLPHRLVASMSLLSVSSCSFEFNQKAHFRNLPHLCNNVKVQHGNEKFIQHLNNLNNATVPPSSEILFLRTSPVWIDTDHGNNTKGLPLIYDIPLVGGAILNADFISAFIEPSEEVTVMIDHFQFLQLTRLSAKLSSFFDLLAADQKHFTGGKPPSAPTVSFLAVLDKIRAHILLTMGPMPSPYDACPAVTDINNSFMDRLSVEP